MKILHETITARQSFNCLQNIYLHAHARIDNPQKLMPIACKHPLKYSFIFTNPESTDKHFFHKFSRKKIKQMAKYNRKTTLIITRLHQLSHNLACFLRQSCFAVLYSKVPMTDLETSPKTIEL